MKLEDASPQSGAAQWSITSFASQMGKLLTMSLLESLTTQFTRSGNQRVPGKSSCQPKAWLEHNLEHNFDPASQWPLPLLDLTLLDYWLARREFPAMAHFW